jgi:hypothetical protein
MQKQIFRSALAASVLVVAPAVATRAETADVKCQIPFAFIVHGTTLPPGLYHASIDVGEGLLTIRGGHGSVFTTVNNMQSDRVTDMELVFHRYGEQYYLREVWLGEGAGRELVGNRPKSESAKTAESGAPAPTYERVVVAAR